MNILNSTSSSAKHAQRSKVRNKINILKYLYTHISMYFYYSEWTKRYAHGFNN